jgi:hypothetical protein
MRSYLTAILVCVCGTAHAAPSDDALSARELQAHLAPHSPDVKACYAEFGRGKAAEGTLRLELTVRPTGDVGKFRIEAPGVDPPWLGRLDACLRKRVPSWRFPARAGATVATVPFRFQKTRAPGAGPIESCWDRRGCPASARSAAR